MTFKGNFMKQKKLSSLLAVTLSLELMVSPLITAAHAQSSQPSSGSNTAQNINQGIQAMGTLWNTVNQARMNQGMQGAMNSQMAGDMAKLKDQQTTQPDKYFNAQKLMQVPGLGEYLAMNNINPQMLDCKTLPTTLHDSKPEVCRIGVTGDRGVAAPQQLEQMFTYYNQYFQTSKMYKNFSADSNSDGQAFGVGCMNNAMNILNGFFKYRLNELDKLTTNLEAMQAQFEAASRSDLDAIEEAVALLEGDSEIANKVKSRNRNAFDFDKRFNNPACKSMFGGNEFNDLGSSNGLNGINKNLRDTLTKPNPKYSGQSYTQSHAAVVADIQNVADKYAQQFKLNYTPNLAGGDYSKFVDGLGGFVTSTTGVIGGIKADVFSDIQAKFMEQNAKLVNERNQITSEFGGREKKAMDLLGNLNSSSSFEAELNTLENGMKNECLANSLGDTNSLMGKIYDPTASKHANKNASNFLKDKLKLILANDKTSPEKKLADLKALESDEGNRFYMRMENSYEVQELDNDGNIKTTVIPASQNRSPSVFFSDVIRNCNAQFKANKLNNKLSGSQAIQKLRDLNSSYKNLAQTQASDIKNTLQKRLIECSSPEIANNTVPGSCTSDLFNTSKPGFCANAALSCSKNMQSCSQQAEKFVKEFRDQKTARVGNYKALVDKNKKDIIKIFDSALSRYMKDGEAMRGMFGAGFSSPEGIKREVPEGQRYLSEFAQATGKQGSPDGKLLLENPQAYTDMFKANIALLKKSVQAQQDQILGGDQVGKNGGLLAEHIKKTQNNYKAVITEADQIAKQCLDMHDNAIKQAEQQRNQQKADYDKKMSELGEKRDKFCNMYGTARTNPKAGCEGNTSDTLNGSLQAAALSGNNVAARESVYNYSAYCNQRVGSSNDKNTPYSAGQLCMDVDKTDTTARILKTQADRDAIKSDCDSLKAYMKPDAECHKTPASTDGKQITDTCSASIASISKNIEDSYAYSKLSPDESSIMLEEAPAYCSAGNNSDRMDGGILKTFNDELAKAMGVAAPQ